MTRSRLLSPSKAAPSSQSTATRPFRSDVLAAIHETAEGLHSAGAMTKLTMRHFDDLCLTPVKPLSPSEITSIREREQVSQAVFARHLGLSITLISQWERGEKKPRGASLKLLTLVDKKGLNWVA